jgi:hypothetical protein
MSTLASPDDLPSLDEVPMVARLATRGKGKQYAVIEMFPSEQEFQDTTMRPKDGKSES